MLEFPIKPADLILVRGDGLVDKAIEKISRSLYSHCTGLVKQNELVESQAFRKTGYQGLDTYEGVSDILTCDILTNDQRMEIVAYVINEVGTKYDYMLIPWEIGHYIFHVDFPFSEGNRRDCSTLWTDAYKKVGLDLCPGILFPTPGDVRSSELLRWVGSF